jgi:hypothetical protein
VAKTGDALARKREAVAASGGDAGEYSMSIQYEYSMSNALLPPLPSLGGADVAWNQSARQLAATSNSHLYYFMLSKFAEVARSIEDDACRSGMILTIHSPYTPCIHHTLTIHQCSNGFVRSSASKTCYRASNG